MAGHAVRRSIEWPGAPLLHYFGNGLGRFPVTLYKEQWGRLLDMSDDIRAFVRENDERLKSKG